MLKKLKAIKKEIVKESKSIKQKQNFLSTRSKIICNFYLRKAIATWREALVLYDDNNIHSSRKTRNNESYDNDYSFDVFDTYDEDDEKRTSYYQTSIDNNNTSTNTLTKLSESAISSKVSERWREEIISSRKLYRSKIEVGKGLKD